jgi:monothiol bacilliredoxin
MMRETPRSTSLHPLTSLDELERALAASWTQPVLLFKHSSTCGASAFAKREIEAWLDARPHAGASLYIVDVHRARTVARAIAEQLRVRHESPQVLLIRDGVVTWHASHFNVSAQSLLKALPPPAR